MREWQCSRQAASDSVLAGQDGPPLVKKNRGFCAAGAEVEKNGQKRCGNSSFGLSRGVPKIGGSGPSLLDSVHCIVDRP